MAYHALLLVRDEADIIAQSLGGLLTWCDEVHVLDTGSTDGTLEIIDGIAAGDRRVNIVGREPVFYSDALRGALFERARPRLRNGDWIARLDADEFAHAHPPSWIAEHLSRIESRVRALMFEFIVRRSDLAAWEAGLESAADRSRPIEQRRRHYYIDPHPEVRLFRYRRFMKWPRDAGLPASCGLTAYERLPIRHYRCRDVPQVRQRCALRRLIAEHAGVPHTHWSSDWRYWIWDDNDPRIRVWAPGTDLPTIRSARAARGTPRHVARQVYYGSGLVHAMDVVRWRGSVVVPRAIPGELQERLRDAFAKDFASQVARGGIGART